MRKYKFIILGAGPSGLTFANYLIQNGISLSEILILEKLDEVGGLCRSKNIDGGPIDIGGGHFLDARNEEAVNFLFGFMPKSEWKIYDRVSKINFDQNLIDYPFESNLWQLPITKQIDYLESLSNTGLINEIPEQFEEWIKWKFGKLIAQDYMLPYNQKIWSVDLNDLGTYWMHKLPDVSLRDTLLSCITRSPAGKLPAHAKFYYPIKYGYGEVWRRMGDRLLDALKKEITIESIDLESRVINNSWEAEKIISTVPWDQWTSICKIPKHVNSCINNLKYVSIDVEYHPTSLDTNAHWIYDPNLNVPHHRQLLRSNFTNAPGFWTETNSKRSKRLTGDMYFHNKYAYPLNTINKLNEIKTIENWALEKNIYPLGRWGRWDHMNSDVAVSQAIALAKVLLNNG